jgi:hypothetical protein
LDVHDTFAAQNTAHFVLVVWLHTLTKVETRNLLHCLLGSYLRAAVVSMQTTSREAMEVALCLTPLDLAVDGAARFTAYKL